MCLIFWIGYALQQKRPVRSDPKKQITNVAIWANHHEREAMLRRFIVSLFLLTILIWAPASATSARSDSAAIDKRIDGFIQSEMQRGRIPGVAVAVLKHGKLLKLGCYGSANLELGVPVSEHSVFELASLTKQFTAAAVVLLAYEGKLSLDDSLNKFIDDVPDGWNAITIRHLLCHSAGLAHRFEQTFDGVFLMDYSTENMLRSAKATPMIAAPGTDWEYSDQGYFLLGLVIEQVTGQSYATFLHERFYEPLDMNETYILQQARIIPNRVAGYTVGDGELRNIRRDWQFGLTSHFGVMSSIADLVKWERALVDRTILPEAVLRQLWSPAYVFREDAETESVLGYGFGWWVNQKNGRRFVEHSGFTGTSYFRDLETQLAVIVLTNRDQPSGPGTIEIAHGIAQLVDPTITLGN